MKVRLHPLINGKPLRKGQAVVLNEALNVIEVKGFDVQSAVVRLKDVLEGNHALVPLHFPEEKVTELGTGRQLTAVEVPRAMSTPPQATRAKVRGDFIRFAREKNRSYTGDGTDLTLNGYWEETILCMDPCSAVNRRVDELVSQVSGLRLYR